MKIGIVTIYESITNLGSFLQGYAMKIVREKSMALLKEALQ